MQSTHLTVARHWSERGITLIVKGLMVVGILIAALAFFAATLTEQYFFPYPEIGTVFSEGYSEANFDQIRAGMSEAEVIELLGEPLDRDRMILSFNQGARSAAMPAGSSAMWSYSHDNAAGIWDFAWLGRFIYFDEAGRVTGTLKWVFYD
jgi:hypothetical protein